MIENQNGSSDRGQSRNTSKADCLDDDNDSIEAATIQQNQEDSAETLSSNGSDNEKGNGSGSGGGYSADCSSSSEASTEDALKRSESVPEAEMQHLRVSESEPKQKSKEKEGKKSKSKSRPPSSSLSTNAADVGDFPGASKGGAKSMNPATSLPQWNGVRIQHPMDPRIDISTVGHVQTTSLSVFPVHVHKAGNHNEEESGQTFLANHPPPSVDQYMTLMEVVRPFFHAHGITNPSEGPVEHRPIESSSNPQQQTTASFNSHAKNFLHESSAMENEADKVKLMKKTEATRPEDKPTSTESDGSSMVVLARVKRKHLANRLPGDPENEESNVSSNGGSNGSSAINSDRRMQVQYPDRLSRRDETNHNERNDVSRHDHGNDAGIEGHHDRGRQEDSATSAASSENNVNIPVVAPLGHGGVPAVVSEYASSRVGSSGSNTNQTSSSGSGSGGNDGSGTGSGSNQGGSSGSGNDNGGMSSNGVGSSGSGNDVKGSGEDSLDNSGANNSGEGNSDESNSNANKATGGDREPSHSFVHPPRDVHPLRESENPAESRSAVREKKLIDKKRKRMNMRREYEEKVQQEMESSEASDENEPMKPGRPITLDKVLSLTKKARIVVTASPPFIVVHTNAAFCRLSGTDSHTVVGKPISTLLSIPDPLTLEGMNVNQLHSQQAALADDVDEVGANLDTVLLASPLESMTTSDHVELIEGVTVAEAGSRPRAATSQLDSVERLVATSGLGRYNIVNVNSKPPHGIGESSEALAQSRNREEGSNGSSLTSSSESYQQVTCSIGIAPVVSSPEAFSTSTEKDLQESHQHRMKRRKHPSNETSSSTTSHHLSTRRNFPHREVIVSRKRQLITHYAIQLEPIDIGYRHEGNSTSSESPGDAKLKKSDRRLQRDLGLYNGSVGVRTMNRREQGSDNDVDMGGMDSESSHRHDCVATVG